MASLRRHPKSKYFIGCYTDATGRRFQRSTKSTDRREAMKLANQWEDAARRRLTADAARKVIADIYASQTGEKLNTCTARDFFTQWSEAAKHTTAASTAAAYAGVARGFTAQLGERADLHLDMIGQSDVRAYHNAQLARVARSTANNSLKILRVAFAQAVTDGLIEKSPAVAVKIAKAANADKNARRPFTIGEIKKLLAVADTDWRGMILAGLYTGQRLGDLAALHWNQVDLQAREITLTTQKTGRAMRLPIAPRLLDHLLALDAPDKPDAPLFPTLCEASNLSNRFYRVLVGAGLASPRSNAETDLTGDGRRKRREVGGLSFYCLRHSATTLLKAAGASEAVAMAVIGHDSKAISANYTHVAGDILAAAVAKLPDVTR